MGVCKIRKEIHSNAINYKVPFFQNSQDKLTPNTSVDCSKT